MSKRDKQRQPERRGAGLSSLRPRLDQLLRGDDLESRFHTELDTLTGGLKPAAFLPTMIAATGAAPAAAQETLDEAIPEWLNARGHVAALGELVERHTFSGEQQERALAWLAAAGADTSQLSTELAAWDPFYDAYSLDGGSQGTLMIFWYTSPRKHRVQGLSLLLDFEPPWDGAVKDTMRYPQRAPEAAIEEFVDFWLERGQTPLRIPAVEAKERAIEALEHNRQSNIRLHPDLIAAREHFLRYVLALPDGPDTPQFTAADFDYLATHGENPEAIKRNERMYGYRSRLPNGEEVLILRGPDDF